MFDVSAKKLALAIELTLEGTDVIFSDNYFGLPAGASVRITAPMPARWNPARARKALRVRSLVDSYC